MRALVANIHRSPLTPIEEAHAYRVLRDGHGLNTNRIAKKVGLSYGVVQSRLLLLELEPEIQELIGQCRLPHDITVSKALLDIPDPAARVKLAQALAARGSSIKTARTAARKLAQSLAAPLLKDKDSNPPAVALALHRSGALKKANWDALRQLGYLPPWPAVVLAARATCRACALYEHASESVCKECPSVALLRSLVDAAHVRPPLPLSKRPAQKPLISKDPVYAAPQ